MQFNIHSAKTNLSKLIEAALAGEDVVIAKGKRPMVRIVPIHQERFVIGPLKEHITTPAPDFLDPMDDDELSLWEGNM